MCLLKFTSVGGYQTVFNDETKQRVHWSAKKTRIEKHWRRYNDLGELRLSGNHTVADYKMSGEPYSQKSGWIKHTNERIFPIMTFK